MPARKKRVKKSRGSGAPGPVSRPAGGKTNLPVNRSLRWKASNPDYLRGGNPTSSPTVTKAVTTPSPATKTPTPKPTKTPPAKPAFMSVEKYSSLRKLAMTTVHDQPKAERQKIVAARKKLAQARTKLAKAGYGSIEKKTITTKKGKKVKRVIGHGIAKAIKKAS